MKFHVAQNNCRKPNKCEPHKMVKHTKTIPPAFVSLSVFDYFVGLSHKGLSCPETVSSSPAKKKAQWHYFCKEKTNYNYQWLFKYSWRFYLKDLLVNTWACKIRRKHFRHLFRHLADSCLNYVKWHSIVACIEVKLQWRFCDNLRANHKSFRD